MINVDLYQQSQKTLEWLSDTQEYTEHFIQEMLAGVMVINNEGDTIYFNDEASSILGIEPKEVIGVNYEDMVEEMEKFQSLSFLKPIFRLSMEEDRVFSRHEMTITGPENRKLTINFNAFPLHRSNGERMGAAMVFMDISAIKDMEARLRQQDHLSILGQMAAKIAHEVKNPLFAIIGLADELVEEESDPDRKHLLSMIQHEAILSNQWISGMLTFSKSPFPVGEEAALVLQSSIPELLTDFQRTHEQDDIKIIAGFRGGPAAGDAEPGQHAAYPLQSPGELHAGHAPGRHDHRPGPLYGQRIRGDARGGHRGRNKARDNALRLRALLHHQGRRHRAWPFHRAENPAGHRRRHRCTLSTGPGNHLHP